jgi:hypothetical protein
MSAVRPERDETERDLWSIPAFTRPKRDEWKLSEPERADGKRHVEEARKALMNPARYAPQPNQEKTSR